MVVSKTPRFSLLFDIFLETTDHNTLNIKHGCVLEQVAAKYDCHVRSLSSLVSPVEDGSQALVGSGAQSQTVIHLSGEDTLRSCSSVGIYIQSESEHTAYVIVGLNRLKGN